MFQTGTIKSAVKSCGRKRLRKAKSGEKRKRWWNQDANEAIRTKKNVYKALLQNTSSFD